MHCAPLHREKDFSRIIFKRYEVDKLLLKRAWQWLLNNSTNNYWERYSSYLNHYTRKCMHAQRHMLPWDYQLYHPRWMLCTNEVIRRVWQLRRGGRRLEGYQSALSRNWVTNQCGFGVFCVQSLGTERVWLIWHVACETIHEVDFYLNITNIKLTFVYYFYYFEIDF